MIRHRLVVGTAALAALAVLVLMLTWDSFPGAIVKGRLGLGGSAVESAARRGRALLAARGLSAPPSTVEVLVRKAARRLVLRCDGVEWFSAAAGLGPFPVDHKEREGDGRTPEGVYYVCTRNDRSRFHLFLGLSYPAPDDAERALAAGRVTEAQRRLVVEAWDAGRRPPWDTDLGGQVGIHGGGGGWDWTRGCVAVDDPVVEMLWALCPLGTRVVIEP